MSTPERGHLDGRTRVAILGGGCGGLAAAWALTGSATLRERFEVTVYERGWQLGGKGASGRAGIADANAGGRRIQEHGLHIWFGFYENAFGILREAYAESGLARGDDWWKVPFEKCNSVSLYDQREDGTWAKRSIELPRSRPEDRGPPTKPRRLGIGRMLGRATRLLATGLRTDLGTAPTRRGASAVADADSTIDTIAATLEQIATEFDRVQTAAVNGNRSRLRGRAQVVGLDVRPPPLWTGRAEQLLGDLSDDVSGLQSQPQATVIRESSGFWRGVLELVTAALNGVVRDEVLWRGFDALDEDDLREWLGRHGASDELLTSSPVLRGLYDLTFAYCEGDKRRPNLAAGKGLQALLMMINYEGAFMWRMRAGMGDVVFAPLYLALRQRGVNFQFFSEVTDLRLMPGRPVIDAIELTRHATVAAGVDSYEPLELIGNWRCWPAEPDHAQLAQLADHELNAETLVRGTDFDDVVLAIPVGALRGICGELARADSRFKLMLDRAGTVRTKALQLWLTKSTNELRGESRADALDPPATAYAEPFDTYCDMSHLLDAESYNGAGGPKGVAYFCAVLPDTVDQGDATESVRASAIEYLERHAGTIWPESLDGGRFDWDVLYDPEDRAGIDRLQAQYLRANVTGTDLYVNTPAGSVDARLYPDQSGFENLMLAGDWTRNGIDGGCVEAAVISGKRAADALIARRREVSGNGRHTSPYVEYGALATAPGPLLCERARLFCFVVRTDRARVQRLCDRVLKEPTGGALRYVVPRMAPVILTFGTIAGLRSLHPSHSDRGSASEPEAAIWIPTIAQRFVDGHYVDEHLSIFMPYLWVDDPIAFASGREVYGYAKTQGWMKRLDDPRRSVNGSPPDPPESLVLDVYGTAEYRRGSELGRTRLITLRRRGARRGGGGGEVRDTPAQGTDLASLVGHLVGELEPQSAPDLAYPIVRSIGSRRFPGSVRARSSALAKLLSEQVVRQVFLKQVRDAEHGERAALQQVVEARSSVEPGTLSWRRLRGSYELSIEQLASHPLEDELGLTSGQTARLAFVSEFGFRMDPGVVRWPEYG